MFLSPKKEAAKTISASMPVTSLLESVPVSSTLNEGAVITIHTHKIIVAREGKFYQFVSVLESITLIAASLALISVSASSIIFAASILSL